MVGLKFLGVEEIRKREPHIFGTKALLVPEEGIVDYKGVMKKLAQKIQEKDSEVLVNSKVDKVYSSEKKETIITKDGEKEFDLIRLQLLDQ